MLLLDTNVLSEFVRKRPDPRVVQAARAAGSALGTSSICVMELRYGCALRPDFRPFWERIEREILARVRVLPFDQEAARIAGDIIADLEAAGRPIGVEDAQIGATALAHDAGLVTFNTRHFERIPGLRIEDWRAV